MATHSSTLAWKIQWMEEAGRLQSMGSLGVRHDWAASLSLFTFMHWRRKWQPTPVFLPGESQGWGRLVGCHLWGCTESDTTEWLNNNNSTCFEVYKVYTRCITDLNQLNTPCTPPHLFLVTVSFFSKSMNLFLLCNEVHLYPFFDCT